jgi:hypothetical protein
MARLYLLVPFFDRAKVQRLGGRWDKDKRRWYISDDADLNLFNRWIPSDSIGVGVRDFDRNAHIKDKW